MRTRLTTRLLAAALTSATAGAAGAQVVATDPGTTYVSSALTGFATTGSDMGGMLVTAFFTDGTSAGGAWGDLGGGTWGVSTPRFSLTLGAGDDTFGAPWRFQIDPDGRGATRLVLRGAPGLTVFDIDPLFEVTPGSARGGAMRIVGGDPYNTVATYRNLVAISPGVALGDLYETLDVTFDIQGGARFFDFITDTDNIAKGGRITATPEPATYTMLGAGIAALAVARRRRRASA